MIFVAGGTVNEEKAPKNGSKNGSKNSGTNSIFEFVTGPDMTPSVRVGDVRTWLHHHVTIRLPAVLDMVPSIRCADQFVPVIKASH